MDLRRNEHIALVLPDSGSIDAQRGNRRSWFRVSRRGVSFAEAFPESEYNTASHIAPQLWNQCTRLQRSMTLMLVLALTAVTLFSLLSTESWWLPPALDITADDDTSSTNNHNEIDAPFEVLPAPVPAHQDHIKIAPYRLPTGNEKANNADGDGVGVAPPPPPQLQPAAVESEPERAQSRKMANGLGRARARAREAQRQQRPVADETGNQVDAPLGDRNDDADVAAAAVAQQLLQQTQPKHQQLRAASDVALVTDVPQDFKGPTNERQKAVVAAFRHAWSGYKEFAWGHDNLKPISMASHDWFGLGLTIVDGLDTMYIMDLQEGELFVYHFYRRCYLLRHARIVSDVT